MHTSFRILLRLAVVVFRPLDAYDKKLFNVVSLITVKLMYEDVTCGRAGIGA